MYVKVNGAMRCLWRALDQEGEILESFVTKDRDKAAAPKLLKKALKRHGLPDGHHHRWSAGSNPSSSTLPTGPTFLIAVSKALSEA
jgi:hypothetical protein